jgi:hypothetical protein
MASTITLAQTMGWAQAYGLGRSLNAFLNNEPALTSSNLILQTITSPPFVWNWNRSTASFLTTVNVQDYKVSVPNFGNIEKGSYIPAAVITNVALTSNVATITANNNFNVGDQVSIVGLATSVLNVTNAIITAANSTTFSFNLTTANISSTSDNGTATAGKTAEISNIINVLGSGSELGSPNSIAPQVDDGGGNITFRILSVPDQTYQVTIIYQKLPALITSTSNTWAPIPDKYAYIYEWGFLALMAAYLQDPRWSGFNQKFVAGLLAVAEGLSEDQKNIFQKAWLNSVTEQQLVGMQAQQGTQARGA